MSDIQSHKSHEMSLLDRIKDEYPSFIIEVAGEPRNTQLIGTMSIASAVLPLCLLYTHREDVGVLHSVGAFAIVQFSAEVSAIDKAELPIQFILGDKGVIAPPIRRVYG